MVACGGRLLQNANGWQDNYAKRFARSVAQRIVIDIKQEVMTEFAVMIQYANPLASIEPTAPHLSATVNLNFPAVRMLFEPLAPRNMQMIVIPGDVGVHAGLERPVSLYCDLMYGVKD